MVENIIKISIFLIATNHAIQLSHARTPPLSPTSTLPTEEIPNTAPIAEDSNSTPEPVPLTDESFPNAAPIAEDSNLTPESVPLPDESFPNAAPIDEDSNLTPEPVPLPDESSTSSESDPKPNFKPTDPIELDKMAFHSLEQLFGKVGPLIYDVLTDKNALGNQMGVASKIITDRIGLNDYTEDMTVIFSNLLNPQVKEKILDVYNKIKDVHVDGTTNRSLEDAVNIIINILQDDKAVEDMHKIIKETPV